MLGLIYSTVCYFGGCIILCHVYMCAPISCGICIIMGSMFQIEDRDTVGYFIFQFQGSYFQYQAARNYGHCRVIYVYAVMARVQSGYMYTRAFYCETYMAGLIDRSIKRGLVCIWRKWLCYVVVISQSGLIERLE